MSDKNNLHSSVGDGRVTHVMVMCGTSRNYVKETDESTTMNNDCSVTQLLQHSNARIQHQKNENEKKHHNFDHAFKSTTVATDTSWRKILSCHIVTAKIKILFLFLMALLSTGMARMRLQKQQCRFFSILFPRLGHHSTQKFNYTRRLSIPKLTLLLFGIMLQCLVGINGIKQNHFVHWNTSNPIFRIDNTDHIIDVNHGNKPWEYDQVNIICPVYPPGRLHESEIEKYIIYSVTKEEYDTCRITNPNPKTIAICNKPYELMYFTITFRSFTPTPGGMEFKPGRNYYFISTSSKDDLYRRVGGHCSTHHMKLEFKIADNNHEIHSTKSKAVNVARRRRPVRPYPHSDSTYLTEDNGDRVDIEIVDNYNYKQFPNYKGYYIPREGGRSSYPLYNDNNNDMGDNDYITSYYDNPLRYPPQETNIGTKRGKKRKEFDIHPNDVIKHEASRMAAATSTASNYYIHCDANKMVLFISVVTQLMLFGFGMQ